MWRNKLNLSQVYINKNDFYISSESDSKESIELPNMNEDLYINSNIKYYSNNIPNLF